MLRQIPVDHKADIGLVDAHAEGDRGHHDPDLVKNECFLNPVALLCRQPRVVGGRGDAALAQMGGKIIRPFAGRAVDDAGFALVLAEKALKLSVRVILLDHLEADVGAVEAADKAGRILEPQLDADVVTSVGIGSRRERY